MNTHTKTDLPVVRLAPEGRITLTGVRPTAGLTTTLLGLSADAAAERNQLLDLLEGPIPLTRVISRDEAGRNVGWCAQLRPFALPAAPAPDPKAPRWRRLLRAVGLVRGPQ